MDLSNRIQSFLDENKCTDGIVTIYSPHTTCCVWLTEDELLHKADVRFFLDKIAPASKDPEGKQKNTKYLPSIRPLGPDVPTTLPQWKRAYEQKQAHAAREAFFSRSPTLVGYEYGCR